MIYLKMSKLIRSSSRRSYKSIAKKVYSKHLKRVVFNQDTGVKIHIGKLGFGESVHGFKGLTKEYLVMLENLPKILKYAERNNYSSRIKSHHKKKGIVGFLNFVITVSIDGVSSRWRVGVAIHKSGLFLYHYSIRLVKMRGR